MDQPRTLLLFDPGFVPHTWSERMLPGEFAVLYSSHEANPDGTARAPYCTVFASLAEAKEHVNKEIVRLSALRCRIYDANGLGGSPVHEARGKDYRGESEMSAGFRRWCGSILFVGGLGLIAFDWKYDFSLAWPGTIGMRAFPAGLILLLTELIIVLGARRQAARERMSTL